MKLFSKLAKLLQLTDIISRLSKLEAKVKDLETKYHPIKYCECCPIEKRQLLMFIASTTTIKEYECPITHKRYFSPLKEIEQNNNK